MSNKENNSRRDFMRDMVRYGGFAILGAFSFALGRKSVISRSEQTCVGAGYCRRCERSVSCGLPAGLSARSSMSRTGNMP